MQESKSSGFISFPAIPALFTCNKHNPSPEIKRTNKFHPLQQNSYQNIKLPKLGIDKICQGSNTRGVSHIQLMKQNIRGPRGFELLQSFNTSPSSLAVNITMIASLDAVASCLHISSPIPLFAPVTTAILWKQKKKNSKFWGFERVSEKTHELNFYGSLKFYLFWDPLRADPSISNPLEKSKGSLFVCWGFYILGFLHIGPLLKLKF